MDMRKTPRQYPKIRIKKCGEITGMYDAENNRIILSRKLKTERALIDTLMHEEVHWAQYMFLYPSSVRLCSKDFDGVSSPEEWMAWSMARDITKRILKTP